MPGHFHIQRKESGFTLVELMVAGVLTVIVGIILLTLYAYVGNTFQMTDSRADVYRDGRAALQVLSREMTELVYAAPKIVANSGTNATNPPASPTPTPTPAPLPPAVELGIAGDTAQTDSSGVETYSSMGFLTRVPNAAQPTGVAGSDICMVAYFKATDPVSHYTSLYRTLIPSQTAFTRLSIPGQTSNFTSDDVKTTSSYAEVVASDVVDFRVEFLDVNMQPVKLVDANTAEAAGTPIVAYIEIVLSEIGARSAGVYFDPNTPDPLRQSVKNKEMRTFTVRWKLAKNV